MAGLATAGTGWIAQEVGMNQPALPLATRVFAALISIVGAACSPAAPTASLAPVAPTAAIAPQPRSPSTSPYVALPAPGEPTTIGEVGKKIPGLTLGAVRDLAEEQGLACDPISPYLDGVGLHCRREANDLWRSFNAVGASPDDVHALQVMVDWGGDPKELAAVANAVLTPATRLVVVGREADAAVAWTEGTLFPASGRETFGRTWIEITFTESAGSATGTTVGVQFLAVGT